MALVRKSKPNTSFTSERKQIIKVNPYENTENVLALMSNICSAINSADTDVFWNSVGEGMSQKIKGGLNLNDFLEEHRSTFWDPDFKHHLWDYLTDLSWALDEKQNTEDTQIVVAGGFSSGKSSFLNKITNSANLLPTGTEPVSVVKTYLYCSDKVDKVSVKGVNLNDVLVDLDVSVLQAIQHANKSNVYLASVLDQLFVTIPSKRLNGCVFIDTPGYNNSDRKNDSNGKSDKETALEAFDEGNVLFWFIDSQKPTITTSDLEILKKFEGKKVIIFNKADKCAPSELRRIVEEAAKMLYRSFSTDEIIDVLAYSTLEDKVHYSMKKLTIDQILDRSKKCGNGKSKVEQLKDSIADLFDTEIQMSINEIQGTDDSDGLEAQYEKAIDDKGEYYQLYQDEKEATQKLLDYVKDIVQDNYAEILQIAAGNNDYVEGYSYYKDENRARIYHDVKSKLERYVSLHKDCYDSVCAECEDKFNGIVREEDFQEKMQIYRQIILDAINLGIKAYRRNDSTSSANVESVKLNVFDCIKRDDYKAFLRCFEEGVDLNKCNADEYNPLTYAVLYGNNMMVRFMLDHDADPSIKDKRGYNAFHTAVENQYRNICKMLLDNAPDLIDSKTDRGESVEDLAQKQLFTQWIEEKIEKAL
jgi:hypothetical protein